MCSRSVAAALALVASVALPTVARADDSDGAYGRLDGDLLLQGGVGAALLLAAPALEIDLHAVYLSSAGVYGRYIEAFGQSNAVRPRSFSTGIEIRPIFLGRWAKDLAQGPARLDLFVDSFAINVGAAWQEIPQHGFPELPSLEMGLAMEFPLLERATGPFIGLTGIFRFDDLEGRDPRDILQQGSALVLTFSWHQMLKTGLVDFNDPHPAP